MTGSNSPNDIGGGLLVLGWVVLGLVALATWMVSHRYSGLFHDARLYALQALALIHPDSLGRDVFLRFGSQDHFTVFSPIFAGVSRLLGVDTAAAFLTLVFQLNFLLSAWFLARTLTGPRAASLGVCLLLAIPGEYGANQIFTCIERFLTPRMAAEALTLGGLAAAMSARWILAAGLLVLAIAVHPIMATAGVAALYCIYVVIPRSVPLLLASIPIILGAGLLVATKGRFDTIWLQLIEHRSPFLFLRFWTWDDWAPVAVVLATLAAASCNSSTVNMRNLCLATAIAMVGGLILTLVAGDVLHLVLVTQAQPWRWQWLGTVVAMSTLPATLGVLWQKDHAGRATAALLVAAWVFLPTGNAIAAAVAAMGSVTFVSRLKRTESRLVFWGACGFLAIAIGWRLASNLQFTSAHYLEPTIPKWLRNTMSFTNDGCALGAVFALVAWAAQSSRRRAALIVIGISATTACALLLPQTWRAWTQSGFPAGNVDQFAVMRAEIPAGSEVFWPESPLAAWMLLGRSNYISSAQTGGMVFSRDAAIEFDRRARALMSALPRTSLMDFGTVASGANLSLQQLITACETQQFEFLVTAINLGVEAVVVVPSALGETRKSIRLYRCGAPPGARI